MPNDVSNGPVNVFPLLQQFIK